MSDGLLHSEDVKIRIAGSEQTLCQIESMIPVLQSGRQSSLPIELTKLMLAGFIRWGCLPYSTSYSSPDSYASMDHFATHVGPTMVTMPSE
eukprot:747743-Amphidinium_carterae.1